MKQAHHGIEDVEIKDLEEIAARWYNQFLKEMRGWRIVLDSLAGDGAARRRRRRPLGDADLVLRPALRDRPAQGDGRLRRRDPASSSCSRRRCSRRSARSVGTIAGSIVCRVLSPMFPWGLVVNPLGLVMAWLVALSLALDVRPLPRHPRLAPLADGGDAVGPKIREWPRARGSNVHPLNARSLPRAASRLRRGDLVAFPTETVYGLGANALDARAVAKIFKAKGRPHDNPLIVHVADRKMLRKVVRRLPALATKLIARFWPGPLTIVLSKNSSVPFLVTAGLDTVAVRMPQGVARDLVRLAGVPVAAPSANVSGRPSPTTARHVAEDFPDVFVLDGGSTKHGVESTVVALDPPRILREGAIPGDFLRRMFPGLRLAASSRRLAASVAHGLRPGKGSAIVSSKVEAAASSPGTKYTHYAPTRPLTLFLRKSSLLSYFRSHPNALVLCPTPLAPLFPKQRFLSLGSSPEEIARGLFAALRTRRRGSELLILAVPRRGSGGRSWTASSAPRRGSSEAAYPAIATNALGKRARSAMACSTSRMSTHSPILCVFCSMPGPTPSMAGCL